jgi:hypothetical protein
LPGTSVEVDGIKYIIHGLPHVQMSKEVEEFVREKAETYHKPEDGEDGFTVKVGEKLYTGAISQLKRFINKEIKGIRLSEVVPEERK